MSTENAQKDWTELRGKIKSKWSKLSDSDIESFKDQMNLISEKIQKVYSFTKDKAEQEYDDFKKTLEVKPKAEEKAKSN